MAGIGFRLERIMATGRLSAGTVALGYGIVLAAGQWLLAVTGLFLISLIGEGRLDLFVIAEFRLIVIFAVMLAMIATAPLTLVATRSASDALYARDPGRVPDILMGALGAATLLSLGLGSLVAFGLFGLDLRVGAVGIAMLTLFSQLWVISGLAGAVQAIGWVMTAYCLGGVVSVVAAIWAGFAGGTSLHIGLGYCAGLALTVGLLWARILIGFPFRFRGPGGALCDLFAAMRRFFWLSVGAFAGAVGLWADKWFVWSSKAGTPTSNGLPHAPLYDTAIFLGLMSIIPGLALLVILLETRFFAGFRSFTALLAGHAPLAELDQAAAQLEHVTLTGLHRILLLQLVITLALIALVPGMATSGLIFFQQAPIVMLTVLSAWFFFLLVSASTLLLHLDRGQAFAAVQIVFLIGVLFGAGVIQPLSLRYLGVAFACGAIPAGGLAYLMLTRALDNLPFRLLEASALSALSALSAPADTRPRLQTR